MKLKYLDKVRGVTLRINFQDGFERYYDNAACFSPLSGTGVNNKGFIAGEGLLLPESVDFLGYKMGFNGATYEDIYQLFEIALNGLGFGYYFTEVLRLQDDLVIWGYPEIEARKRALRSLLVRLDSNKFYIRVPAQVPGPVMVNFLSFFRMCSEEPRAMLDFLNIYNRGVNAKIALVVTHFLHSIHDHSIITDRMGKKGFKRFMGWEKDPAIASLRPYDELTSYSGRDAIFGCGLGEGNLLFDYREELEERDMIEKLYELAGMKCPLF